MAACLASLPAVPLPTGLRCTPTRPQLVLPSNFSLHAASRGPRRQGALGKAPSRPGRSATAGCSGNASGAGSSPLAPGARQGVPARAGITISANADPSQGCPGEGRRAKHPRPASEPRAAPGAAVGPSAPPLSRRALLLAAAPLALFWPLGPLAPDLAPLLPHGPQALAAELSEAAPTAPTEACAPQPDPSAVQVPFQVQEDAINACAYAYPASLPGASAAPGAPPPSWILTRAPERYSSAAPLSPDARLRIVSERLFAAKGVVISVAVSPPNNSFLSLPPPPPPPADPAPSWTPINVARSVLADRTSPRMTSAQRLQETVVGSISSADVCGVRYFYYEFLNSRSPTSLTGPGAVEVFRHSVAVTAEREGYLYTLTASCLDPDWPLVGAALNECVRSFRLLPPSPSYVPPWKDPWRFW